MTWDLLIKDDKLPNWQFSDRYTDIDSAITAIARTIRYHTVGNLVITLDVIEEAKPDEG